MPHHVLLMHASQRGRSPNILPGSGLVTPASATLLSACLNAWHDWWQASLPPDLIVGWRSTGEYDHCRAP
jgi:hypothetical protein